jgi:hypothetical protein
MGIGIMPFSQGKIDQFVFSQCLIRVSVPPVVIVLPARYPTAVLEAAVLVRASNAFEPMAVFPVPLILEPETPSMASYPTAVFSAPLPTYWAAAAPRAVPCCPVALRSDPEPTAVQAVPLVVAVKQELYQGQRMGFASHCYSKGCNLMNA